MLDKRGIEMDEKLADKASKQSVAQALHRKVNKNDNDEVLALKADLKDIQRMITSIDSKVDITSFN